MFEHSQELSELFAALYKFRATVQQPSKDANNPFFKSKYVTLEGTIKSIDKAIKESKSELAFIQLVYDGQNQEKIVETILTHSSGQWLSSGAFSLVTQKKDPQGWGSAITYEKRYQLSALFGIASDVDDDGNTASKSNYQRTQVQSSNELGREKAVYEKLISQVSKKFPTVKDVEANIEKRAKEQNANFDKATPTMKYHLQNEIMGEILEH